MNARKLILDAAFECLETTPIDQIKVADIVEASGVSRPTFYRLYSDKYEMVKDLYSERILTYYVNVSTPAEMNRAIYDNLVFFKENPNVTRNMFFSKDSFALKAHFRNVTCEYNALFWKNLGTDVDDERVMGALRLWSFGIMSFLLEWFKAGMPGDPQLIADQFSLAVPVGVVQGSSVEGAYDFR